MASSPTLVISNWKEIRFHLIKLCTAVISQKALISTRVPVAKQHYGSLIPRFAYQLTVWEELIIVSFPGLHTSSLCGRSS